MEFKRGDGPQNQRPPFWADDRPNVNKKNQRLTGVCKFCKTWSAELKDDLCLDHKCIQGREALAITRGQIAKVITGVGDRGWGYTKDGIVRGGQEPPKPVKKSRKQRKHEALLRDEEYGEAYRKHLKEKATKMNYSRVCKGK
jgi:hypothetical protein